MDQRSRVQTIEPEIATLRRAPAGLPASLYEIVDYRKSGLSLNHIVGCPLDCGYCVRHLFSNFEMKQPHMVMDDAAAVEQLVGHWAFRPHETPLQIFNRATDPFLPKVKDHLFEVLETLDRRKLRNPTLVITRWRVEPGDVERLERLRHLQLTILVTWSGIQDSRIEPVDGTHAERSLQTLHDLAARTKCVLYWRPLIAGLNDSDEHLAKARALSHLADATVFTGLFYREEIRDHFRAAGVEDLYDEIARRKILPKDVERRVIAALVGRPLFRKTSCGVAYAHNRADYNGHFRIREICDICPARQAALCGSVNRQPSLADAKACARIARLDPNTLVIGERAIKVRGSTEQQRYFVQHALNYQVHDVAHPHRHQRHGRAEVGWH